MKTFVQEGDVVTFIAPYAVLAGQGVQVGSMFGAATSDALIGAQVECFVEAVVTLARTVGAGTGWTPGTLLYWDNAARAVTKTVGANLKIGVGVQLVAVADADTTCVVRLNGAF